MVVRRTVAVVLLRLLVLLLMWVRVAVDLPEGAVMLGKKGAGVWRGGCLWRGWMGVFLRLIMMDSEMVVMVRVVRVVRVKLVRVRECKRFSKAGGTGKWWRRD